MKIHPSSIISSDVELSEDVEIGPYCNIQGHVKIGQGTFIESHVTVGSRFGVVEIGKNNHISPGAVIGGPPQDISYKAEPTKLIIGDNNVIREYATMNMGTIDGGRKTVVGNNNLFMANSHVAHDCIVGNNCILANVGTIAGHVTMEDGAILGGLSAVHQFVRLGRLAIIGGCSKVVQDIPPFSMCDGHPAKVYKVNTVGLTRAKVPAASVSSLKQAFRILFHSGLTKTNAIEKVIKEVPTCSELEHLIFFVKTSERGLCS